MIFLGFEVMAPISEWLLGEAGEHTFIKSPTLSLKPSPFTSTSFRPWCMSLKMSCGCHGILPCSISQNSQWYKTFVADLSRFLVLQRPVWCGQSAVHLHRWKASTTHQCCPLGCLYNLNLLCKLQNLLLWVSDSSFCALSVWHSIHGVHWMLPLGPVEIWTRLLTSNYSTHSWLKGSSNTSYFCHCWAGRSISHRQRPGLAWL